MSLLFSKQAARTYGQVWEKKKKGEKLFGEAEMVSDAMDAHPEFNPFWPQGEAAFQPQEIGGYVVNPLVHIGLHVIIEQQLASGDPEEVGMLVKSLVEKGDSRHEAIHKVAGIWGDIYFRSVRRGSPMEEGIYLAELHRLMEI